MLELLGTCLTPLLRRLKRDDGGNVAVIFALATLPIIGFVGSAVDYSTANAAKVKLQAALDSTALMLASYAPDHTDAEIQAQATKYFDALFVAPTATAASVTATYTSSPTKIVLDGSAEVPTSFMTVLGIDKVTINGSSTTTWGTTKLRVALVLDNTGSMAQDGKMTALKAATKSLLSQLKSAASNDGDVYVSIVPFSKDVNVGSSNYTASWIDWSDWDSANGGASNSTTMSGSICYGGTLYQVVGSSWTADGSCSGLASGVCYKGTLYQYNGSFYAAGTCSTNNHVNWNGCITDRGTSSAPGSTAGYDQNITSPSASITESLYPAEQYSSCPVAMKELSYDWTAMDSLIDSMASSGTTNQPIGLVWGWLTLGGGGVFTVPTKDSNYNYQEVVVLLSDGLNTQDRWYKSRTPVDNRMYQTGDGSGTCANIKAAGITIYTLQVNTGGDPTSTLLQNCASSSNKFYLVTSASDIATAFTSIGTELTKLRVAK